LAQAKVILDVSAGQTNVLGSAVTGGGFLVSATEIQPTGTGFIDPFLRVQQNGQERGYNTSTTPLPLDDKQPADGFTRDLQLSEIPIKTIGGVQYREFLLDVNQAGNDNISLNQVQIFQSNTAPGNTGTLTSEASTTQDAVLTFGASATPVFQMNAQTLSGASNEIWIDSSSGSGSGDMFLYVRNDVFTLGSTSYITLFSQFGNPSGTYSSDDGFEEWATRKGPGETPVSPIPEPSTIALALMGLGTLGLVGLRRRNRPVGA